MGVGVVRRAVMGDWTLSIGWGRVSGAPLTEPRCWCGRGGHAAFAWRARSHTRSCAHKNIELYALDLCRVHVERTVFVHSAVQIDISLPSG